MPMGLGDPIDWEPPVLTIVPAPPNPMYVRQGAVLAGTVTDNLWVDRVILREASTGKQLFRATVNGDRWEIKMEFTAEQNNEKIAVEIVAYDRAGNSGDQSMAAVTLVVDIGPPLIEDIWIQRTEIKTASLEQLTTIDGKGLKDLEINDPRGERSANANRYQNGFFTIAGNVAETETRIDKIFLNIYDIRDPNNALLKELEKNADSTNFSPRWLLSEEALLAAGDAKWPGYSTNYRNGERYYYRVVVIAYDKSVNESESLIRVEDEGYFCMWERADIPKGLIDPVVGVSSPIIVTKGATLPIEFYDDDQLLWAYTGLLTLEQWNGTEDIAVGVSIPGGLNGSETDKLLWLRNRLLNNDVVYNWRYGRSGSLTNPSGQSNEITDQTEGKAIDEKVYYVQTGSTDVDNGAFVLFSLVSDTKLDPHTKTGPYETNKPRESLNSWRVDVVDENEPLIVFDTIDTNDAGYVAHNQSWERHPGGDHLEILGAAYQTGNSPEENTFPKLTSATGPDTSPGVRYFTLNGYTLRANKAGDNPTNNKVVNFRMAWIPYGMPGGADSWITQVQEALQANGYPNDGHIRPNGSVGPKMNDLEALGIQHWKFDLAATAANPTTPQSSADRGKLITGTNQNLAGTVNPQSGDIFTKQVFKKRFDILGGQDDIVTSTRNGNEYKNFTYNGVFENETKLFVIFAEDDMGHVVFRQIRLLGNKTPPNLVVYDLTNRDLTFSQNYADSTIGTQLPNLNNTNKTGSHANYYFFNDDGVIDSVPGGSRERYATALKAYQSNGYGIINASATDPSRPVGGANIAPPNTAYTRDTIIKYWVRAQEFGELELDGAFGIHMRDITFTGTERGPNESEEDWLGRTQVGNYNQGAKTLSYVELLPEVTQRVFMFTARDRLGNVASVQRTVAVTNAAVLSSITTTEQTGSYGIGGGVGGKIILHANFSNLVRWTRTGATDTDQNRPRLNVRYNKGGTEQIVSLYTTTPSNSDVLYLEFELIVGENDTGVLQTMYYDMDDFTVSGTGGYTYTLKGSDGNLNNRPITLPGTTKIIDATRGDDAFVPRHTSGFDWTEGSRGPLGSLQGSKTITLDGVRPTITGFVFDKAGKTQYNNDGANSGYFYKVDDTLKFTLTASKNIFTNGSPIVQFQINSNWYDSVPWQSSSTTTMVFSVQVPTAAATMPEGNVTGIRLKDVSTIVDSVGNAFTTGTSFYNPTIINISTGNDTIHIDKTPPGAPTTTIGTRSVPLTNIYFNAAAQIEIALPTSTVDRQLIQYSTNNGILWETYTPGTFPSIGANGQYTVLTRFTDRAGNVGTPTSQLVDMNLAFPNLIAATAVNPGGWYRAGASLSFKLDFAEAVRVNTEANVQIVLTNRNSAYVQAGTGNNNIILSAAAGQTNIDRQGNATITFNWNNISGTAPNAKEMRDGMYISYINLTGLTDRYGNTPSGGTMTITHTPSPTAATPNIGTPFASTPISNINVNVKVDAIAPSINSRTPSDGGVSLYPGVDAAPDKRNTITLNFSEPVMKGSGTITIKPQGDFLVPPVFEDNGYYIDCVTEARAGGSSDRNIWIPGFYDIYNSGLTAAQRNALTEGTTTTSQSHIPTYTTPGNAPSSELENSNPSMTRLRLNTQTGQPVGPYVKTTHGLVQGYGYSGNYTGNHGNAEVFGPNTIAGYTSTVTTSGDGTFAAMVPDTSVKWVLRYGEAINTSNAAVIGIRNALKAAKFRWQEIDVAWSQVNVSGSTVTITLTEPLLQGLRWTLSYAAGTFTDNAGNLAPIQEDDSYTFWSQGVRPAVIRVDRKSYDARTANYHRPVDITTNNDSRNFAYAEPTGDWAITAFNTVAYRIETETPGATITYGVTGRNNSLAASYPSGPYNSVIINAGTTNITTANATNGITGNIWSGDISAVAGYTATTWNAPSEDRNSFWVRPNLLRKFGNSGQYPPRSAHIVNGDQRRSSGALSVLHSYNADATKTILDAPFTVSNFAEDRGTATGSHTGTVTFNALEAGKSYVAAATSITNGGIEYTTDPINANDKRRGYEGIFRTLVVLNGQRGNYSYDGTASGGTAVNKILVGGSNVKAGTPSIPGFPLLEGAHTGDARFVKMMYNFDTHTDTNTGKRFYWVSTEIVCEFYFTYFGNGGNLQRTGDVNDYLMVRYGDLSYAFRLDRRPD
jgi:hypothetical protein